MADFDSYITGFIGSALSPLLNPLKSIGDFLGNLVGAIKDIFNKITTGNNIVTNISNKITNLLQSILDLPSLLVEKIKELLQLLFVPKDDFFQNQFNDLKLTLESKLEYSSYISIIDSFKNISGSNFEDIEIRIMGSRGTILDGSFVQSSVRSLHKFIRGGVYIFLILYNYNMILYLIRGSTFSSVGKGGKTD